MGNYSHRDNLLEELKKLSENTPILEIGDRRGRTDYIDFIAFDEVNYPIMHGIDYHGRSFIVFKVFVEVDGKDKIYLQTIFRRYTDQNGWMGCGVREFFYTCGGIGINQYQFMIELVRNGKAILEKKHRPNGDFLCGKEVKLYVEKLSKTTSRNRIWNAFQNYLVSINSGTWINKCFDDFVYYDK
tara:strand:+ start:197 stop:751 length:555 start_codon:yes stop_codon:yes gene_type:complete